MTLHYRRYCSLTSVRASMWYAVLDNSTITVQRAVWSIGVVVSENVGNSVLDVTRLSAWNHPRGELIDDTL